MIEKTRDKRILLWGATPCTGGSSWQHVNEAMLKKDGNLDALRRLRDLREKFRILWKNYTIHADSVVSLGGTVVNERPQGC
eukprot:2207057-Prorocentrum_lima.AAC.1